jgi:hypothetical protein
MGPRRRTAAHGQLAGCTWCDARPIKPQCSGAKNNVVKAKDGSRAAEIGMRVVQPRHQRRGSEQQHIPLGTVN